MPAALRLLLSCLSVLLVAALGWPQPAAAQAAQATVQADSKAPASANLQPQHQSEALVFSSSTPPGQGGPAPDLVVVALLALAASGRYAALGGPGRTAKKQATAAIRAGRMRWLRASLSPNAP